MKNKIVFISLLILLLISASNDYTVYITPKGKKYHTEFCRTIKNEKNAIKKSEAVKRGYEACKVCNP